MIISLLLPVLISHARMCKSLQPERLLHIMGFRGHIYSLIRFWLHLCKIITFNRLQAALPVATMMPGTVFLLVTGPEV